MDDLVGLFTSTALGTTLLDRLTARINKQKRDKKRAKDAIWQFTHLLRLTASFWSLKCQKKADVYCYVSFLRY